MEIRRYTADFEATTDENDCRVWGWGICSLRDERIKTGGPLDSFFNVLRRLKNESVVYFHNLKYDGEFILDYLERKGFKHVEDKPLTGEYTTLIDKTTTWYSLSIGLGGKVIKIYDSLKIIPLGVEATAKAFKMDVLKGSIDYHKYRPENHIPTEEERKYIENDVLIMAKALKYFFDQDLNKMTMASNAMMHYKNIIGKKNFDRWFPVAGEEVDTILRRSYKGGFTYCSPKAKNRVIGGGVVYDVNSLYPGVMYHALLPYGDPIYYDGEYVEDKKHPLYIQTISCQFELKENKIPIIQIKKSRFKETEYLSGSDGEIVTLTVTSVDLALIKEHYHLIGLTFHHGFKFKASDRMFKDYVDHWTHIKIKAEEEGNPGLRFIAKIMLNSLYGKFGTNPLKQSKIPYYDKEEDRVMFKLGEENLEKPVYVALASFVTAYARETTIRAAQNNYSRFLYADTDSIHLEGTEDAKDIDIHPSKLGAWKCEGHFEKAKFIRSKTYVEVIGGETCITCAGLPKQARKAISFDGFKEGLTVNGSLKNKRVRGGVILKDTTFTVKL